jgi:hypothetical protein
MIPLDEPDYLPTAAEQLSDLIARLVRDAYEATSELIRLRCDPEAARFVAAEEGNLYAVLARVQLLLSEIRAEQDGPKLRVVGRHV